MAVSAVKVDKSKNAASKPVTGDNKQAKSCKKKDAEETAHSNDDVPDEDVEEDEEEEDEEEVVEDEEGDEVEDALPMQKKRKTEDGDTEQESDPDVDPEVKLNEDDYEGLDTSNIIPRTQRRAAAAALAKPMDDMQPKIASKDDEDDDDDEDEDAESDEVEF